MNKMGTVKEEITCNRIFH